MGGLEIRVQPEYCQYADGPCDQDFSDVPSCDAFFVYPSHPDQIAATIETAIDRLRYSASSKNWRSWRDLPIAGRIIFCEICKASRFSTTIVADVTTLNFNLLFEIGFCIGVGIPVIPVRDTTYVASKREFEEIGLLDTIGYLDFTNAEELATAVLRHIPGSVVPKPPVKSFGEAPLYVLKGHINTEGAVKLMSTLKKSALKFRTYDPIETPRLSIHEARKQISGSIGVVGHLLSPQRQGSKTHNALCALLCGIAMAEQKVVIMLQEESAEQPIDYRDVVQSYQVPDQIPLLLHRFILGVVQNMQRTVTVHTRSPEKLLEQVDLGDTSAENEIAGLGSYFVPTGQFNQAKKGHSRLVVGRKGTGKTAIFYEIRNSLGRSRSRVILDLKPEGHQFTKLREAVLSRLSPGLQEHTMAAFWNYILLAELAHKIVEEDISYSQRDPKRYDRYLQLKTVYEEHGLASDEDLSQRLLRQVYRITEQFRKAGDVKLDAKVTELVYGGDIYRLDEAVSEYLQEKQEVWLLIDNLDKGWPTRGTTAEDILIVRALLEATRKLHRQLESRGVEFKCLVLLRTDIYEHLIHETPDKGKDTAIQLDWYDPEMFEEIFRQRIMTSTELRGSFREIWPTLFDSHIGTEDSFNYILNRTLMRPRDLLSFLQRAIEVAVNRGHSRVTVDDILQAEKTYSEDMVLTTAFEISDTQPAFGDVLYTFQGCNKVLSKVEVESLLRRASVDEVEFDKAIELLLWFGFLGVTGAEFGDAKYSYEVRYNLRRLLHPIEQGEARFVLHPGFRAALQSESSAAQLDMPID